MSETVSHTASNLLPLLGLLAGIFLVLIIVALAMRYRVRRTGSPSRRRAKTAADMQAGDVASVLGRTFQVNRVASLVLESGEAVWCSLEEEGGPGRLLLSKDLQSAVYFPGKADGAGSESFPERIQREQGEYLRLGEPLSLPEDGKLARYQGPAEHFLAVEVDRGQTILWRGKSIPPEGVRLIEDR